MGHPADPGFVSNPAKEKEWILRAREGDLQAYRCLVERYQSRIYRLAVRILGPGHGEVDDVVQEAFVKAYFSLKKFRGDSSFGTWITRIAINRARDELKRRPQSISLDEVSAQELKEYFDRAGVGDDAERRLPETISQLVRRTVASLPERLRMVVVLKDMEGLSYEEVSKVINRSIGTVKSRHARARERLRRLLAPHLSKLFRR